MKGLEEYKFFYWDKIHFNDNHSVHVLRNCLRNFVFQHSSNLPRFKLSIDHLSLSQPVYKAPFQRYKHSDLKNYSSPSIFRIHRYRRHPYYNDQNQNNSSPFRGYNQIQNHHQTFHYTKAFVMKLD